DQRREKLAELIIVHGLNVQKNQPVVINATIRDAEFVRLVTKKAYEHGAGSVQVNWRDADLYKMKIAYQSEDSLKEVADWQYDKRKYEQDRGACYLSLLSDAPDVYQDVDTEKFAIEKRAIAKKMGPLMHYTMNNEGQWCVVGLPSVEWAKHVFPNKSDEEAFKALEDMLYEVVRIKEDNDPIAEWKEHEAKLQERANKLNAYRFKELHFTSELGTDVYVGLVKGHIWVGGGCSTPKGVFFEPNLPTEEIFCMPEKTKVNGVVYASKPLNYGGKLIENFHFTFKDGKVVEYHAEKEEEALKQLLEMDEGSSYLGEVALVPYDSPISKSNLLFYETLYDENAACHLALGRPYPENIQDGCTMSEEELIAHGANHSNEHEDFMFGTREMNIDGIQEDGTVIPIFRKGNFVF
ncbi:MAG: aminopeptidase, partial [Solobacterium sp.]|nr:aminopeptidase [Solobacterium sp.]